MNSKIFFTAVVFVILSVISVLAADQQPINNLLSSIDRAVIDKDSKAISDFLSPDAKIMINLTINNQKQVMYFNKEQYVAQLQEGWDACEDYKYQRMATKIKMLDKGRRAVISSKLIETMTIQGQKMKGITFEKTSVKIVNGIALITEIIADVTMQ